jgi:hypothetical protein
VREEVGERPSAASLTLKDIQQDPVISAFITQADRVTEALGYTEHGFRHATLSGNIAFQVLTRLGRAEADATLGAIGGYLHDIGNMISRTDHGQLGALLIHELLRDRMHPVELALVMGAVGNHEEDFGAAVSEVSAAVILADKSDVHRSRVRKADQIDFDIHDRVNYAAEQSFLRVDAEARSITLELTIDTEISHVMEYFEIFLDRMLMCRRAAEVLECRFGLEVNETRLA